MKVFRYAPGVSERMQEYAIELKPGMTILDALIEIQQKQDLTLAFRYACRVGMCGSCTMVVNGRERWACRTLLAAFQGDVVSVRPLYHFPLIRDLVVDMGPFAEKMKAVGAAFVPREGIQKSTPSAEIDRERTIVDAAVECIGCGACVSACTVAAHNQQFPGPAALTRAFTLMVDDRDGGKIDRWGPLLSEDGLVRCHTQASCTAVCPMELNPTDAILRLRRRAIALSLRSLV